MAHSSTDAGAGSEPRVPLETLCALLMSRDGAAELCVLNPLLTEQEAEGAPARSKEEATQEMASAATAARTPPSDREPRPHARQRTHRFCCAFVTAQACCWRRRRCC